jgi:hypothetical protein
MVPKCVSQISNLLQITNIDIREMWNRLVKINSRTMNPVSSYSCPL